MRHKIQLIRQQQYQRLSLVEEWVVLQPEQHEWFKRFIYHWAIKLGIVFLERKSSPGELLVEAETLEIDLLDISKQLDIYLQYHYKEYNTIPTRILMGSTEYAWLCRETCGVISNELSKFFGIPVTIVPWMDGILPVDETYWK